MRISDWSSDGVLFRSMRVVTERREGRAHDAFGEALVADRGDVIDAKTALPFRHEHIFAALLKTVHPAAGVLDDIGEFLERVRFARSLFVENLAAHPVFQLLEIGRAHV